WGYIYHPLIGILNQLFECIGLYFMTNTWIANPSINMFAVSIPIILYYIRPYLIIFISAIQNIPCEVEYTSLLDGATRFKKLKYITLPMVWTTVKIAFILAISGSLKAFDQIYIITGGGPAQSTELMATYMYNNTFMVYRYG